MFDFKWVLLVLTYASILAVFIAAIGGAVYYPSSTFVDLTTPMYTIPIPWAQGRDGSPSSPSVQTTRIRTSEAAVAAFKTSVLKQDPRELFREYSRPASSPPPARARQNVLTISVEEHGAIGDGVTLCTKAIQSAIDACSRAIRGGHARCTVFFPKGAFLSGPINLESHVWLRIPYLVTLLFAADPGLYEVDPYPEYPSRPQYPPPPRGQHRAMLRAYNCTDVGITGGGAIDGRSLYWHFALRKMAPECKRAHHPRCAARMAMLQAAEFPQLVQFQGVDGVTIEHILITNPPGDRGMHVQYSQRVRLTKVAFTANGPSPTKGLVVDSSHDVLIHGCQFLVEGMAVTFASGVGLHGHRVSLPTDAVLVTECEFFGGEGLSLSADNAGGLRNITATSLVFNGTAAALERVQLQHKPRAKNAPMGAISILGWSSSVGGLVENVQFEHIYGEYIGTGVKIDMMTVPPSPHAGGFLRGGGIVQPHPLHLRTADTGGGAGKHTQLRRLYFRQMMFQRVMETAFRVVGHPGAPVESLFLK
ncbi:hypothetical protein CYMTET_20274, partial [Cymbomonas tetramitiformis]